jgi:hypothetical protein
LPMTMPTGIEMASQQRAMRMMVVMRRPFRACASADSVA